jgi:hypothetical protein
MYLLPGAAPEKHSSASALPSLSSFMFLLPVCASNLLRPSPPQIFIFLFYRIFLL